MYRRGALALALLALVAAAQPRIRRSRIAFLLAEPKPLTEDEVAAATERAFSVTRVPKEQLDPANKETYAIGQGKGRWSVRVGTRVFTMRCVDERVLDEDFALEKSPEVVQAMAAHRGFMEFYGADLSLPPTGKARTRSDYEIEKRKWEALCYERDIAYMDALCRLAVEFADRKPTAIYVANTNALFVADETSLGWMKMPRAYGRLSSGIGVVLYCHSGDREMEAASRKAKGNWGRFAGSFGRKEGEGHRVLVNMTELDRSEPVWVLVKEIKGDQISGTILKEPLTLNAEKGDEAKCLRRDLVDLAFEKDGETFGDYTLEVKRARGKIAQDR